MRDGSLQELIDAQKTPPSVKEPAKEFALLSSAEKQTTQADDEWDQVDMNQFQSDDSSGPKQKSLPKRKTSMSRPPAKITPARGQKKNFIGFELEDLCAPQVEMSEFQFPQRGLLEKNMMENIFDDKSEMTAKV